MAGIHISYLLIQSFNYYKIILPTPRDKPQLKSIQRYVNQDTNTVSVLWKPLLKTIIHNYPSSSLSVEVFCYHHELKQIGSNNRQQFAFKSTIEKRLYQQEAIIMWFWVSINLRCKTKINCKSTLRFGLFMNNKYEMVL